MSQCVPSWDLDNNPSRVNVQDHHSNSANSLPMDVPSLDFEQVAELTWKNGQLAMHGLGPASRQLVAPPKPPAMYAASWEKPRAAGGTLESLVDQATSHQNPASSFVDTNNSINVNELVPWFDHHRAAAAAAAAVAMDALVPSANKNSIIESSARLSGPALHVLGCSARVGSCSGAGSAVDGGVGGGARAADSVSKCGCASESATCGAAAAGRESRKRQGRELGGGGPTSTSLWSPENTSSGGDYTRTSAEELDSGCHSRPQTVSGDRKRKAVGKSSVPTKSRAAAIHNQSERKRRDKINQRMKTLQKMVPNSSKTDKASMLDEVIEYLKQLQAQVHVISRMNMAAAAPMMLPLAAMQQQQQQQQQLQMSMMSSPMGMGIMADIAAMARPAPPLMPVAGGFMPLPPSWDISERPQQQTAGVMPDILTSAYLACQSQPNPMTVDAYSRMQAALYQQFQHPPAAHGSKNL